MSVLSSYSLSDFLLFAPRVYERLFELHNDAMWPAHCVAVLSGFAIISFVIRTRAWSGRVVYAVLGIAWLVVAWAFFLRRYQTINWAADYVAPVIASEGVLLLVLAVLARAPDPIFRRTSAGVTAMAVLLVGLLGYPLIAPLSGRSWHSAEFFGLTPDPTAVVTLAVMALSSGAARWMAILIPTAWCIVTGLTLWALSWPDFFVAPLAAALALGAAVEKSR
jgi:uncharacterized membrane protein YuzA (DUF378 family)